VEQAEPFAVGWPRYWWRLERTGRAMVESLDDLVGVMRGAEPARKAALYESLGLALKYEPSRRRVLVEADLGGVGAVRVGGGI
jgi:hypothetical protein